MGRIYARGGALYLDFLDYQGKRARVASGYKVGDEALAQARLDEIEAKVAAKAKADAALAGRLGEAAAPLTVRQYADRWTKGRRSRVRTAADEASRLALHVLPRIGDMAIADVRPRHVRDLVLALRDAGRLAPRTVIDAFKIVRRMFRSALTDELVTVNPCELEDGILPPNEDKDPEWRDEAVYTRAELEQLISHDLIRADRRVVYGLKGLAGLRHGEAAALRWKHYDAAFKPLGRLIVANTHRGRGSSKGTKTGVTRWVPVHPVLAAMLAEWRLAGWERLYGRAPKDEDLVVPTDELRPRNRKDAQDALLRDLVRLGLRKTAASTTRRGHDFRATLTTLALDDGAAPHLIRMATHGQPSENVSERHYTRVHALWPAICAELAKLKIERRAGKVLEMPLAAAAGAAGEPMAQAWHKDPSPRQPSRKKETPRSPWVVDAAQPSQPMPPKQAESLGTIASIATHDQGSTGAPVPSVPFGQVSDGEAAEEALAAAVDRLRLAGGVAGARKALLAALADLE